MWYVKIPAKYVLILNLKCVGRARVHAQIRTGAKRRRNRLLHELAGVESGVPELASFPVPPFGEFRPPARGPGWNVDLERWGDN